jgi:prophage regulatory protein
VTFLRTKQVLRMLGVSRTTLWRMVQAGEFPRPVTISRRATGHVLEEVEAWMKARALRAGVTLTGSIESSHVRTRAALSDELSPRVEVTPTAKSRPIPRKGGLRRGRG